MLRKILPSNAKYEQSHLQRKFVKTCGRSFCIALSICPDFKPIELAEGINAHKRGGV